MLHLRCQTCLLAIVQLAAISELQASNEAPYFIEEPSDIYVRKGKPASLSCVVGGDPKPAVRWRRNGLALDITGDSRRTIKADGSLHFSQIIHSRDEKPDEGKYQCEALSRINNLDYRIVSKTARVIVAGLSSKVTVAPATLKVEFGGIARFYCSIKHSVPKALIHWKKKGEPDDITTGGRFTLMPGGALQISNVQFTDQGDYDCIAENNVTSRSHTSANSGNIEVLADRGYQRPPRFVIKPLDTVAIAGSSVVLECAVNGSPKPRITWLHNGIAVVLENQYSIIGESNLKIEQVSVSNAGVYICRAKGGDETEESQAELAVHYPPVFTKRPRDIHAYLKSNGRFECEADGIPKPVILWSKSGVMIVNNDYTQVGDGYLLIEGLAFADEGVYQCIAKNSLGDIQETAELFVYRRGERIPSTTPTPTTTTTPTTTPTPTPTQGKVPDKPHVTAWPHSDTEIEVTWTPPNVPNGKILAYTIFYSLSGDVKMVNTSGNNLRKMITNLKPDTNYSFNVFATNKHGSGQISTEAVAKTYASSDIPGKSLNLVAEAESESTIRVTWTAPDLGSGSIPEYVIIYKEADSNSEMSQVSTKQQTWVLRYLKPYTKYTITVFVQNPGGGKVVSSTVEATTKGGVPLGPPRDFVLKSDNSGTGLISTWKPPDPTKRNGEITYYIIKFKKVESQEENETERIGAENLQHNIKGLTPSTKYQAKIAAGTDSGLGVFTKDWVEASTNRTECKENSHPGKPKITKVKAFSNMIVIKWAPPDDAGLVCVTGYNLGWGEVDPFGKTLKLDSDKLEYIIQGLKSNQRYVIMLSATNSLGPGEDQQIDVRTLHGGESPEVVKGLQAFPLSPKVMHLTWKDTHASTSVPVIYHVYHSVHSQVRYCGNTTHKVINCSGLKPYTKYIFYVRRNMEESNATVSNYTDEDRPSSPLDLTGNPDEKNFTLLALHWQPPLRPNGHILQYRIYYSNNKKAADEHWTPIVVDGSRLTQEISGLDPGGTYFFRMQAQTKKGWGPLSEVKEITTLSEATPPGGTAGNSDDVSSAVPPGETAGNEQPGVGELKNKTLWIIIAAVAGITLIAIIIISVILCKKRSGDDIQRKPPTYKSVIQANGSAKKKHKEEKPPDLWINHTDHLEMKPMESANPAPDVTNTSSIPRNSKEMKPLNDSPIDHIALDHERNSFMNGNDNDPDDIEELPPPPVIDSKDEPYPEYIETGNRTPTPPPSPVMSPYCPPRPITPENVRYPVFPMTSTPRYQRALPRTGSYENALEVPEPRPPQRARSYDPDFTGPSPRVPVFPGRYPISSLPKPRPKPPVAPADDIQLPPVGYSRTRPPNGYWTPPPKYEDIFTRRSPPSSPPRNQETVVADLDKEIAGLEGLMRDLNEITAVDL